MMRTICKGLAINRDSRRIFINGHIVDLPELEFRLMDELCRRPGRVVPVIDMVLKIYPDNSVWVTREAPPRLKQLVYRLRNRIGFGWVVSVSGRGYRLGVDL